MAYAFSSLIHHGVLYCDGTLCNFYVKFINPNSNLYQQYCLKGRVRLESSLPFGTQKISTGAFMKNRGYKKLNEKGQSAIEFIVVVVVVFFFLLFYLSFSITLIASEYVDYATFMAARTYKSGNIEIGRAHV